MTSHAPNLLDCRPAVSTKYGAEDPLEARTTNVSILQQARLARHRVSIGEARQVVIQYETLENDAPMNAII